VLGMPTFDVVSQVDMQEVRNAVDQAARELVTRFDFRGTSSSIDLVGQELTLRSSTEDRLKAVLQVLEEKLVRRQISLKALDYGKIEEAAKSTVRQVVTLKAGIGADQARAINRFIKENAPKGVSSSGQGDQVRVSSKKRDELQVAIGALKEHDFGIPLQFENCRD
jgi:cyclic-di-GMP-binding protein